ncbi:addiction module antidote protein [Rugamonas apoptosis]|uniref:addiction module antidote protein n=1 Tax=Rugamonas apoptosis TaxID=2758570 RepID=UPI001E41A62E|nr:addiction module antidote protein [Rugamonas apoptosis]
MGKLKGLVSHHEAEVAELRADRELAVEYLKAAMESLDDPDNRAAGLLALRTVAEAYGGLAAVAAEAGISRETLYRTLSPKGNPTLRTLLAVLKTVGMRLSVEPEANRGEHAPDLGHDAWCHEQSNPGDSQEEWAQTRKSRLVGPATS